jgi:Glycosyl hydrolase family 20, catalytic domain
MSGPTRRQFLAGGTLGAAASRFASGAGKLLALGTAAASRVGAQVNVARPALPHPGQGAPNLYGLMADAARVPEDVSYYRRLIDFCHHWKLNALLLSLTDDQGSALRFRSHPELITHPHALTCDEAQELAGYARGRGVELIPIIESFGHTRYITGVPQYARLADRGEGQTDFNGLIPVAPETLRLITDLYREVAKLFPSPYLHGGCDEVNWGGSELSRRALRTRSRAQIWADYLNSLDGVARGLSKELIVWGDYVLHKEPEILPLLHKDIIIMDWQYYVTDPKPIAEIALKAIGVGHCVIGAPAIISCRWGPRAGRSALENIDAYADAYKGIDDSRAFGVIVTNWVPCRYIQKSLWDTFAYAAVAIKEGSANARKSAFRRFIENHYGAEWNSDWSDVFTTYYNITPNRKSCSPSWMRPVLPVPWKSDEDLKSVIASEPGEVPPFTRLLSHLVYCKSWVRNNFDDFLAFELSAEYVEHLFWRQRVIGEEKRASSKTQAAATQLIQVIAERDARLLRRLDAAWNAGRPHDAPSKRQPVFNLRPGDQLLYTFRLAAEYSDSLSQSPDRFFRMMTSS